MSNDAVRTNGFTNPSGTAENHITGRGSNWLYAVCAVMGISHI